MPKNLPYKLVKVRALAPDEQDQFLVVDRQDGAINVPASLYAAHLATEDGSLNSAHSQLMSALKLLTWSKENLPNFLSQVCSGVPPTLAQVKSIKAWLRHHGGITYRTGTPAKSRTFNAAFAAIRRFIDWLLVIALDGNATAMTAAREALVTTWQQVGYITVGTQSTAPDLTDKEIAVIEAHLVASLRSAEPRFRPVAARDYLMWRLALEYALRVGEMLSLRLVDLPSREENYLKIVRLEHRENYFDPRPRPPSVKTLGRDLGIYFETSAFPALFSLYVSQHRWVWATRSDGSRFQKTKLSHNFLLVSTPAGNPLSISGASTRAQVISKATGVDFSWHIGRHSFFNRAHREAEEIEDKFEKAERLAGLVYLGGWISEDSLQIYTRSSRRNRSRKAGTSFYREGGPV